MARPTRFLPFLLALAGAAVPSIAAAEQVLQDVPTNNTRTPAIAYNSDADQYLVVYVASYGRLEGQILDADGTPLEFIDAVLPHYVGETTYREPRLTYRPADNRYVMTAILEIAGLIPTVDVTVTTLDENAEIIRTDDVPGFIDTTAETPDVMGDTFPGCCTLVTWKQSFGSIFGQRYDAAGFPIGSRINIYVDSGSTGSRAFNPRIAYQRGVSDDFAVVWQFARNGLPGQLQARLVEPVTGALGTTKILTDMIAAPWARYGEKFPGGPDIAYDETGARYYIAWLDQNGVKLIRSPANLSGGSTYSVFTNNTASGYLAHGGTPEVTIAEDRGKAYVSHPLSMSGVFGPGRPAHWVHGWWFSATGVFPESPLSTWWAEESADNVVAAFSPVTDTVLGVWERDEFPPVSVPPPNDIYFEIEDVP